MDSSQGAENGCAHGAAKGRFLVGLLLAAASVVGFASTFVVGAELTKDCGISPSVLSFLRFAVAGGVLFAVECAAPAKRRRLFSLTRREWLLAATLGPVGTSVMAWCVFRGCALVSAANASMADALAPLLIFALAALRARRATFAQMLGVAFGFAGAVLVIGVVNSHGVQLSAYSAGDVFVLLAAATWAFYSVYGRDMINRVGSGAFSAWTMVLGAAAFAPFAAFGDATWPASPRAWWLVAVLGFVCTLMPFWTWNAAQKYLPISTLGVSAYFTPVVAVVLALVFLGEPATPLQWLGTLLVCASALVESRGVREQSARK